VRETGAQTVGFYRDILQNLKPLARTRAEAPHSRASSRLIRDRTSTRPRLGRGGPFRNRDASRRRLRLTTTAGAVPVCSKEDGHDSHAALGHA
jgi:hypothetical protein